MKRFLTNVMCIVFILCLSACGSTTNNQSGTTFPEPVDSVEQTKNEDMSNADILDKEIVDGETNTASGEESEMKFQREILFYITAVILFCIMLPIHGHIQGLGRWICRNRK